MKKEQLLCLLAEMSLEEKAGQLAQIPHPDPDHRHP